MALFPIFVDLKDKEILVVGGGRVALRKVEKLLPFGGKITVVAPKAVKELKELHRKGKIKLKRRPFKVEDLKNKYLVVVAADDVNLQRRIFNLCQRKGILCNSVDSPEYCNFIFPALVRKGELVIGITTSGKAPALAALLRKHLERNLPDGLAEIVGTLYGERKKRPKGVKRQKYLKKLARELFEKLLKGKPPQN